VQAIPLSTGADLRALRPDSDTVVLCVNGGTGRIVPGTWSPTLEWLVDRLAPRFPDAGFAQVRYRVKSWKRLPECIADGHAALDWLTVPRRVIMLGVSVGGASSERYTDDPRGRDIIGLTHWIPEHLPLPDLTGDRVQIIHGSIDGWIPGVPGVRPSHSRGAIGRLHGAGAEVSYRLIRGAVHGLAVRPRGRMVTLPRAGAWESAVEHALRGAGAGGDQR